MNCSRWNTERKNRSNCWLPKSSALPIAKGQLVRICQIGAHWVGVLVSASPYYMLEADGVIQRTGRENGRADLVVFAKEEAAEKRLLLAGCDPATGFLSRMVEKISAIEIVSAAASSKLALTWLKEGKVHVAGSHLEDPKTGNLCSAFEIDIGESDAIGE
jgi:putative molybdopterin biosynthesis protein